MSEKKVTSREKAFTNEVLAFLTSAAVKTKESTFVDSLSEAMERLKTLIFQMHVYKQIEEIQTQANVTPTNPSLMDNPKQSAAFVELCENFHTAYLMMESGVNSFFREINPEALEEGGRIDDFVTTMSSTGASLRAVGFQRYGDKADDADLEVFKDAINKLIEAKKHFLEPVYPDLDLQLLDDIMGKHYDNYQHSLIALVFSINFAEYRKRISNNGPSGEVVSKTIQAIVKEGGVQDLLDTVNKQLATSFGENFQNESSEDFSKKLLTDENGWSQDVLMELLLFSGDFLIKTKGDDIPEEVKKQMDNELAKIKKHQTSLKNIKDMMDTLNKRDERESPDDSEE